MKGKGGFVCNRHYLCGKDDLWNIATWSCKNGKNLASIIDDSVRTCDKFIEETKTAPTNLNNKNITCKTQHFCIFLAFLLITIALLIAVSIYCYLIKYRAKQKHLLPFHIKNDKLREVLH